MSNTLLLISDEHNPFYSSVYGHPFVQTPNMDWLAQQGTVFDNAYCPSPLCMPCRSAFMTGKRVHQIQSYNNCAINLDLGMATYGGILAEQGVHTVHIGKTHVYSPDSKLGFSEMIRSGDHGYPGDTEIGRHPLQVRHHACHRADGYGLDPLYLNTDLGHVESAIQWLTAAIKRGTPHGH
jgi:choline-sulfatase